MIITKKSSFILKTIIIFFNTKTNRGTTGISDERGGGSAVAGNGVIGRWSVVQGLLISCYEIVDPLYNVIPFGLDL